MDYHKTLIVLYVMGGKRFFKKSKICHGKLEMRHVENEALITTLLSLMRDRNWHNLNILVLRFPVKISCNYLWRTALFDNDYGYKLSA